MLWRNVGRRPMWREFDRLQREMNRIFDSYTPSGSATFPPLNVWADEERVLLTAELPGVDPDDLDISIVGETLTLSGERPLEQGNDVKYHRRERWHGNFSRTMEMPFRIDSENVEASFRNGILEIVLPRAAEDKPRRISVSAQGAGA
ncbi:MAG TPA: Hsp20/alpha crystallin family protein [Candidatus Sulfomarinibacteraceae bacterium]|nr:Hsp20/alpha crystallin family protein [Candidatus Sulfomarinibacteraceae bacterium]